MILSPTMRLRWTPVGDRNDRARSKGFARDSSTAYGILQAAHPESSDDFFVLQQWWSNGQGGGEWRDIEIDHSYTNNPPE